MTNISRRRFMALGGAGLATIPLSSLVNHAIADGHAKPMVDPASPQAVGLQYVAESTVEGKNCANCVLYVAEEGAEKGGCALFQGQMVAKDAYCIAWAAKG